MMQRKARMKGGIRGKMLVFMVVGGVLEGLRAAKRLVRLYSDRVKAVAGGEGQARELWVKYAQKSTVRMGATQFVELESCVPADFANKSTFSNAWCLLSSPVLAFHQISD